MSSLYEIINDTSKFLKLPSNSSIGREGKLQLYLCTLKKKGFFSRGHYENIYPSGSQPAGLYGNSETHKLKSKSFCKEIKRVSSTDKFLNLSRWVFSGLLTDERGERPTYLQSVTHMLK